MAPFSEPAQHNMLRILFSYLPLFSNSAESQDTTYLIPFRSVWSFLRLPSTNTDGDPDTPDQPLPLAVPDNELLPGHALRNIIDRPFQHE